MHSMRCSVRDAQKGVPMKLSSHPFALKKNTLTLIHTDLAEPEALVRELAEETQTAHPTQFAGKTPCVYFKLPYVPPCENFHEIRRLTLRIHEHTGPRAQFQGIVAIDSTEWLGHEKEDFFGILLKYLFDHSNHWHCSLILKNCTDTKLNRFMRNILFVVPGFELHLSSQMFFTEPDRLEAYCRTILRKANKGITQDGVSLLATVLMRDELSAARSLALIDHTIYKLIDFAPNRKIISEEAIRLYLELPDTMLAMMLGAPIMGERNRNAHESQL